MRNPRVQTTESLPMLPPLPEWVSAGQAETAETAAFRAGAALAHLARSAARRVRDRTRLYRTAPSNPIAQTWKLPFAKSIASILIGVVIDVPSLRFR